MDKIFAKRPNGYQDSISKGIAAAHYFRGRASYGKGSRDDQIKKFKEEIENADAILIGAGAGLSTSAGFIYRWFLSVSKERDILGMVGKEYLF